MSHQFKLGRKPGVSEVGSRFALTKYMTNPLPVWNGNDNFLVNSKGASISDYGMLGNGPDPLVTNQGANFQGLGDCGPAGDFHLIMNNRLTGLEQVPAITGEVSNAVVAEYMTYDNNQDEGVDLGQWLLYRTTHTLAGMAKIAGFLQVNPHGAEFASAIHLFGAGYAGIMLSEEAMDQAENTPPSPWTSAATDFIGGHCVPIFYRDADVGKCVTWGFVQEFSWQWWAVAAEEMYVVLSEAIMNTPGGIYNGVNVAALKADIIANGGTV